MRLALSHSPTLCLQLKLSITGVAVWVLAAHQQFPLAQYCLHGLTLGYGGVLVSHLLFALGLV
jgi:Domain of unknown function (DUF5658)